MEPILGIRGPHFYLQHLSSVGENVIVTVLWLLLFAKSQLAWTVINFVIELDNRLELVIEVTLWQKIVSNMKIMYLFNGRKSGFGSSIKHD